MNMYKNKVAVAIKTAGKVLREQNESVAIPFGSEFSVFIKNLHTVRASIKVEIDGVDIGDGTRFVVQPNSSIDLERYIKAGNLTSGNCFKFIERTGNIEGSRGIKIDDGLIRVEFQFEKIQQKSSFEEEILKKIKDLEKDVDDSKWRRYPYWYDYRPYYGSPRPWGSEPTVWCNTSTQQIGQSGVATSGNISEQSVASYSNSLQPSKSILRSQGLTFNTLAEKAVENEVGITVPGSVSNQQFTNGEWFATETETHSIVLKIVGKTEKGIIKAPITVKSTQKCSTCNHNNKMTSKFCVECGTSLIII